MNTPTHIDQLNDGAVIQVQGHIKIYDLDTLEVYVDKRNAIHYENFSVALARSLSNQGNGFITEMSFGNGGSRVDPTGIITYLTPNSIGSNANLYNQTYTKVIDAGNPGNTNPTSTFMENRHIIGTAYTDILVSCVLDYAEPANQLPFDNATSNENSFVFDELGLRGYDPAGNGPLLTHVIFHPVQKALNRAMKIEYTVRIHSVSAGV